MVNGQRHTRVPASACPTCGAKLNAASDLFAQNRPVPGDLAVCGWCGAPNAFDDNLLLRPATADDLAKLERESPGDFWRVGAMIVLAKEGAKARGK